MKVSEFHELTDDQMQLKDDFAIKLAKDSISALVKALPVTPSSIPRPNKNITNLVKDIDTNVYSPIVRDIASQQIELLLLLHALSKLDIPSTMAPLWKWEPNLQAVSDACYYLACHDIQLMSCPQISADELYLLRDLHDIDISSVMLYRIFTATAIGSMTFTAMRRPEVVTDTQVPENAQDIPPDLLSHLQSLTSVRDVLLEVCRLQMLGPKSRRANDALDSVINSWNILNKEKDK